MANQVENNEFAHDVSFKETVPRKNILSDLHNIRAKTAVEVANLHNCT